MADKALVIIDVQKCFLPGGSLAVAEGDNVVSPLNRYIELFRDQGLPIYATRDWHPNVTIHFKAYGGLWPPHCIQNTPEAEFAPGLELPENVEIISAGIGPDEEGYSGFEGFTKEGQSFMDSLQAHGIRHLYVGGIATDYCVRYTVLDALRRGFRVTVLTDAIRGVDLEPGDSQRAIDEMVQNGAKTFEIEDVEKDIRAVPA
ncbi:MAG: isochorismatase family protein [Armatimonadota bacterium]